MSGGKNIVAACTAAIASSLGAVSLLAIGRKRRHSTRVKKYNTRGRERYGKRKHFVTGTEITEVVKYVGMLLLGLGLGVS